MAEDKVSMWAHPSRVAACEPDFVNGFRQLLGEREFEDLSREMRNQETLTSQIVAKLTSAGAGGRLKRFIEETSRMAAGTEMGNSYAALLYLRHALSPQPYFLVADSLVEMLEHTDLADDIPVGCLTLPYPRFYLELGTLRTADAFVPNVESGLHRLEGMYCETGTHPDFGKGLYVMLTGSPAGKRGPLDDATNSIFLPTLDENIPLPEALRMSFARAAKLSQAAGLRQSPEVFVQHSLRCLNLWVKALLYISMPEARRVNKPELTCALEAIARKKSPAKQIKARRALAGVRDYILIEAPPASRPSIAEQTEQARKGPRAHWRRGHYRMQAHGEGRQQRKLVLIRPQLIAAQTMGDTVVQPQYLVRRP